MILEIVTRGYDVSGILHGEGRNMYSAALNRRATQKKIRAYRELYKGVDDRDRPDTNN
jgi:hypothetical protein